MGFCQHPFGVECLKEGGVGGWCFLNALVARRNCTNASMPSLVLRMSDVMRSSEASLRAWCWFL